MRNTGTPPKIEVATYMAPKVTVTRVTSAIPSEPVPGAHPPGSYQRILLNTATGELSFNESTEHREPWDPSWKAVNDVPVETWERWHPGKTFSPWGPHMWFDAVPELLRWIVESDSHLDVVAANALLELVAPYAQELLDGLFEAGGELDWSAASARAGRQMLRLTSRHREAAPPEVDADLIDFSDIVERFPQVYRPEFLGLSLDKLAEECEYQTRFLGSNKHWHPEIKKVYGTPYRDGSGVHLDVLGVRAWYRTVLMNGNSYPARDFRDWDAEHRCLDTSNITSETTDAGLDAWIRSEETRAAQQGVRLFGTREAGYSHRDRLRERDWDRLAVVGAEIDRLKNYEAERRDLVARIVTWNCYGDSDIADRGRLTRQAVHRTRQDSSGQPRQA